MLFDRVCTGTHLFSFNPYYTIKVHIKFCVYACLLTEFFFFFFFLLQIEF